jgi:hypothetical protein
LQFTVAAFRDLIRSWRGRPPYYVPVVAEPGHVAVFTESEAGAAFAGMGGEATGWRNQLAPRFVFKLPRYVKGAAIPVAGAMPLRPDTVRAEAMSLGEPPRAAVENNDP